MTTDARSKGLLPIDLEEILPLDAMRRIADVGLIGYLAEYVREQVEGEPALQWDASFLAKYLPFLDYVLRYFDAEVEGLGQVPQEGPMLLVGNHSGGTLDDPEVGSIQRAVAAAVVTAGEAAHENSCACIQIHGGMGYTWEVPAHYYMKRSWVLGTQFGDRAEYCETFSEIIEQSL